MKYDHVVKYNGIYYPAGADVPVGDTKVEEKKEETVPYEGLPFVDVPETETAEVAEETAPVAPKKKGRKKKTE